MCLIMIVMYICTVNFSYENKLVGNAYQSTLNETYSSSYMYPLKDLEIHTLHVHIETLMYSYMYTPLKEYSYTYTYKYTPYSHYESAHTYTLFNI